LRGWLASAIGAVVLYATLLVWLTWPLAAHLGTHLPDTRDPCRYDPLYMGWVLAYETHALTTAPGRFLDANIFHPAERTLFYGDTGFGALPYFMPVMLATGNPTLALNLLFLGCIALTAASLHLVAARTTGSAAAGFVAATTFLTTRWVLWDFVATAPSYATLQYFPWIVFLSARREGRARDALRLVPLVVLQCLTDVVYLAAAVLVPLATLAIVRILRSATRRSGMQLLAVVAAALVALAPVYAGHLAVRGANPGLASQTIWRFTLLPTTLPWEPIWFRFQSPTTVTIASLVLIAIGVASLVLERRRQREPVRLLWRGAAFWASAGLLFSLTPMLYWEKTPLRLPPSLVSLVSPFYRVVRSPERMRVATLIAVCLLAALAFARCTRRLADRARLGGSAPLVRGAFAVGIAALMYAQYSRGLLVPSVLGLKPLPRAYPIAPAIDGSSPLVALLAAGSGPVLELPVGKRRDLFAPVSHARAMYRSIHHWRPLLNGYDSYWPAEFPDRMALAGRLPAADALAALRATTGLETILVHLADLDPSERAPWGELAERHEDGSLRLIGRDGDDLLFAVGPR